MPDAKSGYYWIDVNGKKKEVFCDMVNYGMIQHVVDVDIALYDCINNE